MVAPCWGIVVVVPRGAVTSGATLLPEEVTRGATLLPEVTRGNTVLPEEVFRVVVAVGVVRDDGVWSERTVVAVEEVVFIGERETL